MRPEPASCAPTAFAALRNERRPAIALCLLALLFNAILPSVSFAAMAAADMPYDITICRADAATETPGSTDPAEHAMCDCQGFCRTLCAMWLAVPDADNGFGIGAPYGRIAALERDESVPADAYILQRSRAPPVAA